MSAPELKMWAVGRNGPGNVLRTFYVCPLHDTETEDELQRLNAELMKQGASLSRFYPRGGESIPPGARCAGCHNDPPFRSATMASVLAVKYAIEIDTLSDEEITAKLGCSREFVARVRNSLGGRGATKPTERGRQ